MEAKVTFPYNVSMVHWEHTLINFPSQHQVVTLRPIWYSKWAPHLIMVSLLQHTVMTSMRVSGYILTSHTSHP